MITNARLQAIKNIAEKANDSNVRKPFEVAIQYINTVTPETVIELIEEIEKSRLEKIQAIEK